jgi:hypothetical protein
MRRARLVGILGAAVLAVLMAGLNWGRPLLGLVQEAVLVPVTVGMLLLVIVGALITERRPRNPVGWLLLAAGAILILALLGSGYAFRAAGMPGAAIGNWVGRWLVVSTWVLVGFITLLFPDGRLPSRRWVWFARSFAVLGVVYITVAAVEAWPQRHEVRRDLADMLPFLGDTTTAALWPAFAALLVGTLGALVVRYRRGGEVERAQIRWLGLAGSLSLFATGLFAVERVPPALAITVGGLASMAPAVAIGVAILRYRLYEIDRIISRTVTYGVVTAVLVAVYAVGVVVLSTVLVVPTGETGGDLVVAASTLAAVALFRPLRARVQGAVDRRFNRAGYEARQVVGGFAGRVREEVDLETIRHSLATTAQRAVEHTTASGWLTDAAPPQPTRRRPRRVTGLGPEGQRHGPRWPPPFG